MRILYAIRFLQSLSELGPWWWSYDAFSIGGCCVGVGHCANWVIARTDTVSYRVRARNAHVRATRTPP